MKTKYYFLSLCLMGTCRFALAQEKVSWKPKYGVKINYVTSSLHTTQKYATTFNAKSLSSVQAGAFVELPIIGGLSVQPEVLIGGQGGQSKYANENVWSKETLLALNIPVNFIYNVNIGVGQVYAGAGPYLGYALSGKYDGILGEYDLKIDDESGDFKKQDYGINFSWGFKSNYGIGLSMAYQLGLRNISPNTSKEVKNAVFSVGLSYSLHKK